MLEHSSPHFSIRPTAGNGVNPQFSSIVAVDGIAKHEVSPDSRSSDDGEVPPLKRSIVQSQHSDDTSGSSSDPASCKAKLSTTARSHPSDSSMRGEGPLIASFDEDGVSRDTRPQDSAAETEEELLRKPTYKLAPMAPIPQLKPQAQNKQSEPHSNAPKNNIASRGQLLGPMEPMELKKTNDHHYRVRKLSKGSPGFPPFPGLPIEDPGLVSPENYDSGYGGDSEGYDYVRYSSMNTKTRRKKERIPSMSEVSRLADAVAAEHHAHSNDDYRRAERNGDFPNNVLAEMYSQTINGSSLSYPSYGYTRTSGDSYMPPTSFQRKVSMDIISDFNQPRPPNSPSVISGIPLLGYGGPYIDGTSTGSHALPPPPVPVSAPIEHKSLENIHGPAILSQGPLHFNLHLHGPTIGPHQTKEDDSNNKLGSTDQHEHNHHHHHHHHHHYDHHHDHTHTNIHTHSCQGDCSHDPTRPTSDIQAQYTRQLMHSDFNHNGVAELGPHAVHLSDAQHSHNDQHQPVTTATATTAAATPAYPIVFSAPPPTMGVSQVLPFSMVSPPGPVPAPALAPSIPLPTSSAHNGEKTTLQRQSNNVPPPQTEERIYKCTHPGCEWSFTRSSDFKRHLRSHEKPSLKCPYWELETDCNRKGGMFYRLDVLKRHLRLVHLIRPTDGSTEGGQCRVCLKKFSRTKDFIAHCDGCAREAVAKKNAAKASQAQAKAAS